MDEDSNHSSNEKHSRGILSKADREYLQGKRDLSDSAERNTRQRIRERVKAGLADFELLWTCLSDRDLELIFNPDDDRERRPVRSWSHHAIAFIQLGLWTNRDPHGDRIADAIEQAAFAAGWATDVDVDLTKQRLPEGDLLLAKIQHKTERLNELQGRIAEEDFGDLSREELREEMRQEASLQYYLYEKALQDPTVDSEDLASAGVFGLDEELTAEDIEKERDDWEGTPVVRRPLPVVVDVSPVMADESRELQSEDDT